MNGGIEEMLKKPLLVSVMFFVLVLCPLKLNAQYKVDDDIEVLGRFYDFSDDFKDSRNHFLEQYTSYRGYFGDDLDKFFYDLSSLDIHVIRDRENTNLLNLQHRSLNYRNQRNSFIYDLDGVRLDGKLGFYRSNTLEIVPVADSSYGGATNDESGYASQFNDDSGDFKRFYKQRLPYSLGMSIKPSSLGMENGGWLEQINLKYDGYIRDGERFSTYVLSGSSDVTGAANSVVRAKRRWRGLKQEIDERVDRFTTAFVFIPEEKTVINLDFTYEHFINEAKETTLADISRISGIPLTTGATEGFNAASSTKSIMYVPDTNKFSGAINFKRRFFKKLLVKGSYKASFLDQHSFSTKQHENGFDTRQIFNQFINLQTSYKLLKNLDWDIFVRYTNRNNISDRATGFFTREELSSPRIAGIENLFFGTNFTYRASFLSSVFKLGFEREETDRNLNFNSAQIDKSDTTYGEETEINKVFLKTNFRPYKNLTARINTSFRFASQTGLLTEPDTEEKVKLSLNYYYPKLLHGLHISPFYQVKIARSGLFSLNSATTSNDWKREDLFQSAGATVSLTVTPKVNVTLSYFWNDINIDTNFLRTNRRKYETTDFTGRDAGRSDYDVREQNITTAAYWNPNEKFSLNGAYTLTLTDGDISSGEVDTSLGDEGEVENLAHLITAEAAYNISKDTSLSAQYNFISFDDDINRAFSGHINTISFAFNYKF
jgi:hypothetical protein